MRDEQFEHAITLFNQQEFFACHDVLEEIWSESLEAEREFYQGLIHAAVSLFHFSEGNLTGARKMHDSTVRYLTPFQPIHAELDIGQFLVDFDRCFEPLLGAHQSYPQGVDFDEVLIPKLRFLESESPNREQS